MANASPHNAQDGGNPGGMVRNNSLLPAGQLSLESCEVPMQQTASKLQAISEIGAWLPANFFFALVCWR
jgi:hypothetical protein